MVCNKFEAFLELSTLCSRYTAPQNGMVIEMRAFGIWRTSALVVGNMVGSGIFMLPASLAIFGAVGLVGWGLSAIGAICLAVIFSRLSHQFPKTGGPYVYAREAFGDFVGFQMAWSYWIGSWAGNAAIATAFVSYMSYFFPLLKMDSRVGFLTAFAAVWFFTLINALSIRFAGIAQLVLTLMKVVPLALICIFGLFYMKLSNFLPFNPSGQNFFSAACSAAALTLYAFLGLESATVPADDVIDPAKTIPRATLIGTVISAVIYIWSTVVLLGVIPASLLAKSNAPFAEAGEVIFGAWAGPFIAACAALSAFGTLNGWILLQGQMPLAAARDGLFPAAFKKLSKHQTPVFALVLSSCFLTGVLVLNYHASLVDQFTAIVNLTTFAILLPYLYSAIADLMFIVIRKGHLSHWHIFRSTLVTLIGFVYTILIVIGSGQQSVFLGIIWVFAGFPVYAFMKRQKEAKSSS